MSLPTNRPPQRLSMSTVMSALALTFAAAALGVSVNAKVSQARAEEAAYQRIVGEVWQLAEPMYKDFGVNYDHRTPATLTEVMGPYSRLIKARTGDDSE